VKKTQAAGPRSNSRQFSIVAGILVQVGVGYRVKVQGAGCRVQVQGAGCRVQGTGYRVQGTGYRVQSAEVREQERAATRSRPVDKSCKNSVYFVLNNKIRYSHTQTTTKKLYRVCIYLHVYRNGF
jgi:hypothetical protein